MASERVILSNGGVCNVDTSDHYPGALHVTINGGATLTPAECDALIAAIGRALGRPAPASTPLEERILRAWDKAKNESETHPNRERAVYCDGTAHGLRAALAMVREQGATVPRAGVEAARERFDKWIREEGGRRNEYVEGMTVGIKDAILALDTLLAAPATQPEKG